MDIDFVPSFKFCDTHWPQPGYKENPSNVMVKFINFLFFFSGVKVFLENISDCP